MSVSDRKIWNPWATSLPLWSFLTKETVHGQANTVKGWHSPRKVKKLMQEHLLTKTECESSRQHLGVLKKCVNEVMKLETCKSSSCLQKKCRERIQATTRHVTFIFLGPQPSEFTRNLSASQISGGFGQETASPSSPIFSASLSIPSLSVLPIHKSWRGRNWPAEKSF